MEAIINIEPGGMIRFIHDDELAAGLKSQAASVEIKRASNVEPAADGQTWEADMAPVAGPVLAGFETRGAALAAEVAWLKRNIFSYSGE